MAISLIAKPYTLTPAYNEVKYIYDSTNKNLPGFKYVYDIYQSGTANKIGEYRVLPVYGTGYGEVDLSMLLMSYVSYDLNLTNTTVYNAPGSHYKYDVHVGEEYISTLTYTSALTQYLVAPYVGRVQINLANSYSVGDQIVITEIGFGASNPSMQGLFTVLVANPFFIVVNVLWSTIINPNKDGQISYADGRRTIIRSMYIDAFQYVFNGAIKWVNMPAYDWQDYMLNTGTDQFLTNLPGDSVKFKPEFNASLSQDLWLNAVANYSPGGTDFVYFQNNLGEVFRKSVNATDHVSGISVGPNNHGVLTPIVGVLPMIKPAVNRYQVWYERAGVQVTKAYNIGIDRRVRTTKEYVILFLDRMGSWGSFAFTGRDYEKGNISKTQYNQKVEGYVTGSRWTYNTQDRGYLNNQISTETTLDLNTNWMTEAMAEYFVELLSSPYTFIKTADYSVDCEAPGSTRYISCNILTSSFEIFKERNKNLIKQSIQVKLANNDVVNG